MQSPKLKMLIQCNHIYSFVLITDNIFLAFLPHKIVFDYDFITDCV